MIETDHSVQWEQAAVIKTEEFISYKTEDPGGLGLGLGLGKRCVYSTETSSRKVCTALKLVPGRRCVQH